MPTEPLKEKETIVKEDRNLRDLVLLESLWKVLQEKIIYYQEKIIYYQDKIKNRQQELDNSHDEKDKEICAKKIKKIEPWWAICKKLAKEPDEVLTQLKKENDLDYSNYQDIINEEVQQLVTLLVVRELQKERQNRITEIENQLMKQSDENLYEEKASLEKDFQETDYEFATRLQKEELEKANVPKAEWEQYLGKDVSEESQEYWCD